MSYQFLARIRYSETDEQGTLSIPALIDYLQDASTFQSEDLGNGGEPLRRLHRAWILAYWQIEILRLPRLCDMVQVSTWPHSFKSFQGGRNYQVKDMKGNSLVEADSLWIYLDTDTGHPARVDAQIRDLYPMEEALPMEKASRKVPMPEGGEGRQPFGVRRTFLDSNGHVNNVQYIRMACEYLEPGELPRRIRVEYKKSALYKDRIHPVVKREKDRLTVGLFNEEGLVFAVVEFQL